MDDYSVAGFGSGEDDPHQRHDVIRLLRHASIHDWEISDSYARLVRFVSQILDAQQLALVSLDQADKQPRPEGFAKPTYVLGQVAIPLPIMVLLARGEGQPDPARDCAPLHWEEVHPDGVCG